MKTSVTWFGVLSLGVAAGLAAQPYPAAPPVLGSPGAGFPPQVPPGVAPWRFGGYPPEPAPGFQDAAPPPQSAISAAERATRPAPPAPVDPAAEAGARLKEGMDRLLGFLGEAGTTNKLQVAAFLDREIAPYFDFDYMTRWVAGPAYAAMSPKDRSDLTAWLESDFLSVLANNLAGYQGQQIRMLTPRRDPRGTVGINVAILRPGDYPATLQFRMAPSDKGWRVYDVVADGRSAASFYRVQFQRMTAGQAPNGPAVR